MFVLANLVTVVAVEEPFVQPILKIRAAYNEIGYPYTFWRARNYAGIATIYWGDLVLDVAICLVAGTAVGLVLSKFADPNRHIDYLCKACGYDLRGMELDVCPECGTTIARSSG